MLGAQAVGRAFSQALRQEYQATAAARRAAEEAGRSGPQAAKASTLTGMGLKEAKQILNVDDIHNIEAIRKVRKVSINSTGCLKRLLIGMVCVPTKKGIQLM